MAHHRLLSLGARGRSWTRPATGLAAAGLVVALACFYVAAAREHARVMNLEKSRGDQTQYVALALEVYANRHGRQPPIVHGRNRMPLYPWLQSWGWDGRMTHWDFFYVGREQNIRLSVALLSVLGAIFWRLLRPLAAVNLTLILAFGCFIYKAGYFQPELLFYSLFFCAFLACCRLLGDASPRVLLALGAIGGVLAALAQLTKAAMLPLVGLFLAVQVVGSTAHALTTAGTPEARGRWLGWRLLSTALFAACFLAVLSPYLSTSKRVFGHYFYNVNTTFYVWYDSWAEAIRGTRAYANEREWPRMPQGDLPGARKYLREHTAGEVAARLGRGAADMLRVSYRGYNYLKYVVLYAAFALLLVCTRWREVAAVLRGRARLVWFVSLLGAGYLAATAFYEPISGTGTARFLLIVLAPLMFAASWVFSQPPLWDARWRVHGVDLAAWHFHALALATLALDIVFTTWPRLMTTYGGF